MDQKLFRSILMIITYTVLLVLVILQFDKLLGMLGHLLQLLKPVYIGFALAFVLNRPCQGFYRLYHRDWAAPGPTGSAVRWRWSRPMCCC